MPTTNGFPTPPDSDFLSLVYQRARELAQAVNDRIGSHAHGRQSVVCTGTNQTGVITMPAGRFASAPSCTLTVEGPAKYVAQLTSTATGSIAYRITTRDGSTMADTVTLHWHAVRIQA